VVLQTRQHHGINILTGEKDDVAKNAIRRRNTETEGKDIFQQKERASSNSSECPATKVEEKRDASVPVPA